MFKGTREQVYVKAKRPILEMWVEEEPDFNDDAALTEQAQLPKLVRIGTGLKANEVIGQNQYMQSDDTRIVRVYHVDIGSVFVHPTPVRKQEVS